MANLVTQSCMASFATTLSECSLRLTHTHSPPGAAKIRVDNLHYDLGEDELMVSILYNRLFVANHIPRISSNESVLCTSST